jgi:hypothetical protein
MPRAHIACFLEHHLKLRSGAVLCARGPFYHFSSAMIEEIQLDFQHAQFCCS